MPEKLLPPDPDAVSTLVFFLIIFAVVGAFFLFIHLVMGAMIRPNKPDAEKLTIYECGEPTVGSAWVQFDLRYYVVALLFVIFDVEVAFFFPWATVFGTANQLADVNLPDEQRIALTKQMQPSGLTNAERARLGLAKSKAGMEKSAQDPNAYEDVLIQPETARGWAQIAFLDILVFFGVLMVGFAYVWRRGDIDWVRAYAHHQEPPVQPEKPLEQKVSV